jgi:hypothetical protein
MHLSLDGFVAGPNGEMNWIKVDEKFFSPIDKQSVHCPRLAGEVLQHRCDFNFGVE